MPWKDLREEIHLVLIEVREMIFENIFGFLERKKQFENKILPPEPFTDKEFFLYEMMNWKASAVRKEQLTGQRYYEGEQDIKRRKRTAIGEGGKLTEVNNLPNNKITDNQYSKAVDQKVNYLLGKPFGIKSTDENYDRELNYIFDKNFYRLMKQVGKDSLNCGIGWIYVYYDEKGELSFKRFKPWEIMPFWTDETHSELEMAVRVYPITKYVKRQAVEIEKVEIYSKKGIERYVYENGKLLEDKENISGSYMKYVKDNKEINYNWGKIPIVPFKYNDDEIPLIRRCKDIQDAINDMLSDFANNMQEDNRNTILVLKNYDGENLGEFRRNLATYGAVKVRTADGGDGGVETLNVSVNSENYKAILSTLKKALIENAKAFDSKDEKLSGNPNQMNILSMYSDIDLDSKGTETEYKAAFEKLLWFADMHLINTGAGDFTETEVQITFNRAVLMNEGEQISNVKNSMGIVSNETLLENHPWVSDVQAEIERMEKNDYSMPIGNEHGVDTI